MISVGFKFRDLGIFVILLLIVFQSVIEKYFSLAGLWDEVISIIAFAMGIAVFFRNGNGSTRKELLFIGLLCFYIVCGSLSSFLNSYQNFGVSIASMFLSIKWFLLFIGFYLLSKSGKLRVEHISVRIVHIIVIITVVYQVYGLCTRRAYLFTAWDMCAKAIFLIALLWCTNNEIKMDNIVLNLCLIFLLLCTKTAKGNVMVAVIVFVFSFCIILKKQITWFGIAMMGSGSICLAWKDIYFYLVEGARNGYARAVMYMTASKIASDYFPMGTGWGTFGSFYSAKFYSPVYYLYGLDQHIELGIEKRLFIHDSYIPILLAETGWVGLVCVVSIMILFFVSIGNIYKNSIKIYSCLLICFIYILITFVEETGLQQPSIMCLAIILGVGMGNNKIGVSVNNPGGSAAPEYS